MKRNTSAPRLRLLVATVVILMCGVSSFHASPRLQQNPKSNPATPKTDDPKSTPKPPFSLSVKTKPILNISLKAEKARLGEIGSALSKRLKIPVIVSPELEKELVSTEFSELTLEPAMQLLAPSVYIDYEIRTGSGAPPRPLGVFFYGANQGEPPVTAIVTGSTQSILIEGDTEEGVEPETDEERKKLEEQPLRVSYANSLLSVKAKKQPLVFVLLKIGEQLGIPVDIQNQSDAVVDIEVNKMSVEDVVQQLGPNIQLFLRADLTRAERRALRLVLSEAPKQTQ